jgi:PIN domain nuclease of toxin-antitoxin system
MIGDRRLKPKHRKALDAFPRENRPRLATISLWEACMLVTLGRLHLDVPLDEWFRLAASAATVRLIAITPAIACEVARLPDTFQRDPANRIIVSTSRNLDIPLLTYDGLIRGSKLVTLAP